MTSQLHLQAAVLRIQRAPRCESGSDKVQRGWKGWEPCGHTAGELPHPAIPWNVLTAFQGWFAIAVPQALHPQLKVLLLRGDQV